MCTLYANKCVLVFVLAFHFTAMAIAIWLKHGQTTEQDVDAEKKAHIGINQEFGLDLVSYYCCCSNSSFPNRPKHKIHILRSETQYINMQSIKRSSLSRCLCVYRERILCVCVVFIEFIEFTYKFFSVFFSSTSAKMLFKPKHSSDRKENQTNDMINKPFV